MFKGKLFILGLFLLGATPALAQQSETLENISSWQELVTQAGAENKLIFVDLYFTGCHPCKQMDEEVFPNELIRNELKENFISVKIDVFKEKLGDTINMKFGVTGFPTFLIFNAKGQLLSYFSGYKDPGLLLHEINKAKVAANANVIYGGFEISNQTQYPLFYQDYFNRENGKRDYAAANIWLQQQKNLASEPAAMAIFRTAKLDKVIEDYVINNYKTFRNLYGENLAQGKAVAVLISQMEQSLDKKNLNVSYDKFLKDKSSLFPKEDWSIINFILGYKYYGTIAKDTMKLLEFINEDPIVYANYIGALYSNLSMRKQLNPQTLSLLCAWAEKAVTSEVALDMMMTAAYMHKQNKDMDGYKRFIKMAIAKAQKYKMDSSNLEKMLVAS